MSYFIQFIAEYEIVLSVTGSLFGIAGSVFGIWRYLRERQARRALDARERELTAARSRLKHLELFAQGLGHYSKAV